VDFRKQLTLALLSNPSFFTDAIVKFESYKEGAAWLGLPEPTNGTELVELGQSVIAVYVDGLVQKIIEVGEFD
jgi:hypothetical protein